MKKISKKIIAIILIAVIVLPFYSFLNKVEASEYKTTTTISNKAEYISANKGMYKDEKIKDVIYGTSYTEYRWKYKATETKTTTQKYKEQFSSTKYANDFYTSKIKDKEDENLGKAIANSVIEENGKYYCKVTYSKEEIIEKWTEWQNSNTPPFSRSQMSNIISSDARTMYNITVTTEEKSSSDSSTTPESNGGTSTESGSSSTNGNSGNSSINTGSSSSNNDDEKIYTSDLSVGDKLKFTGNSWTLRNEDKKVVEGKYLNGGETFRILAIDGNYLKIVILAGENIDEKAYIKYAEEASTGGYFTKVDAANVGNTDESEEQNTTTIDGSTPTKNLLYNIYSGYYNIVADNKQDTNAETIRGMINDYATEIESGKSTVCDIVEKMIPEDKLNLNISDEEFANRLYKAFSLVENPTDDEHYSLVVKQASKSRSEALGLFLVTEIPDRNVNFYALCKKYGIEDKNVIGRPNDSSQTTTNTNKSEIESFIKSIIEKANVKISDEDKNKLIDNLASGEISGATAVKTVIESDEFKNLKLTDSNYIKVISKICLGEDISDTDLQTYEKKLIDGTTRNELLKEFILNSKFQTICDNLKITRGDYTASPIKSTGALAEEFVKNVYTSLTGKDASNIGSFSSIVNGTQTATEVIQAYVNSTAFKNRKLSDEEYVKALFKAALNRAPSQDEINTYTSKIKNSSQIAVIDDIVKTDEFKKICNQYYLTAGKYEEYVTDSEKEQVEEEGNVQIIRKEKTTKDGKKVIYLEDVVFDLSGKTKGDVNGDKNVSVEDAVYVLTKAVALTLNDKSLTQDELTYVDIDSDEMITVQDAQYILTYYARKSAALNPTWEEVVSGNYNDQNQIVPNGENTQATNYNTEYKDGYLSKVTFGDDLYYTLSYYTVNGNEKVLNEVHKYTNDFDIANDRYSKEGALLDRQERTYYSNGKIKSRTNYNSKGEKIYYWEYDDNGKEKKFEEYSNNKIIVHAEDNYDELGNLKSTDFYDGETNNKIETVEYDGKKVIVKKYSDIEYKYNSLFVWQLYDYNEVENILYEYDSNNIISDKISYYENKTLQCYKVTENENIKYYNEKNEEITEEQFNQRRSNPIQKESTSQEEKVDTSNKITEITINNIKFKLMEESSNTGTTYNSENF